MMFPKIKFYGNSNESGYFAFLLIILLSISSCQSNNKSSSGSSKQPAATVPAANGDYFQEIGKEIGLDFVHSIGAKELTNIVESSGAGAAFLDYDQDGFIDLYVCSGTWLKGVSTGEKPDEMPHNHLYHNRGDGTFEDVTKKAGVGGPWYSMGVTVGDFNNDGYLDVAAMGYPDDTTDSLKVFLNNRTGGFGTAIKPWTASGNANRRWKIFIST